MVLAQMYLCLANKTHASFINMPAMHLVQCTTTIIIHCGMTTIELMFHFNVFYSHHCFIFWTAKNFIILIIIFHHLSLMMALIHLGIAIKSKHHTYITKRLLARHISKRLPCFEGFGISSTC